MLAHLEKLALDKRFAVKEVECIRKNPRLVRIESNKVRVYQVQLNLGHLDLRKEMPQQPCKCGIQKPLYYRNTDDQWTLKCVECRLQVIASVV